MYARDAQNVARRAGGAEKNILRKRRNMINRKKKEKNPLYYTT